MMIHHKIEDKTTFASHLLLFVIALIILIFFIWATQTQIDEIARGQGVVIPSGQNQLVQNLEGGVVAEILVQEGDIVQKGDILLQIANTNSRAKESSALKKREALLAKKQRLEAQAHAKEFLAEFTQDDLYNRFLEDEKKLFIMQQKNIALQIEAFKEQRNKKKAEQKDNKQQVRHLQESNKLILEEIEMITPLVEKGIKSKIDLLKLQREFSNAQKTLSSTQISIEKTVAEIAQIDTNMQQIQEDFKSRVREELNEVNSELAQLESHTRALSDQVERTTVRAPRNGIVKKLFVNTIGGAIKPAQDLVEIVPVDETLLVEVKIKPSDIAFIYHQQDAIVRFSAYDFSIYGGIDAKVVAISPDTIKEENETYYLLRVKTEQNSIKKGDKKLKIIPGMVSDVDILTGKKSVLAYIARPLLKTMQYTFSER